MTDVEKSFKQIKDARKWAGYQKYFIIFSKIACGAGLSVSLLIFILFTFTGDTSLINLLMIWSLSALVIYIFIPFFRWFETELIESADQLEDATNQLIKARQQTLDAKKQYAEIMKNFKRL